MKVRLLNNEGTGSVANQSPISYSYSEDVTSLEPSTLDGGSGQITVSALAVEEDKINNTRVDSRLLINNSMSLTHDESGQVDFIVKQVSLNAGVVNITGETISTRLNVEATAEPHGGPSKNLFTAINYYCSLVNISVASGNLFFEDDLQTLFEAIPVNFIGWKGNVWEHLKMLCAAVSIDANDNLGFEFYTDSTGLVFRKANITDVSFFQRQIESQSISVDTTQTAQSIDINNYNTTYKTDAVVQDTSANSSNISTDAQGATIFDGMQVNAGEGLTKRFVINASLETVNQPTAVDAITPFPYTGGQGQYAVSGADGVFIKAEQWIKEGGQLSVSLTENPNEIEVVLVAPIKNGLENILNDPASLSYEPYKIAVETSGSVDYPAIYITGTGVFYNKTIEKIFTGASVQYTAEQSAPNIDNPFITNKTSAYTRGAAAAQVACGPNIVLSESVSSNEPFGSTPGLIRTVSGNRYRIRSVNYNAEGTSYTAQPITSFLDFNNVWTGFDFSDFTTAMIDPAIYPNTATKFNEFTVIPLLGPGA
jgi:hypothetical protein